MKKLEVTNSKKRAIDVEMYKITSKEMDEIYWNNRKLQEKFGYSSNGLNFDQLYVKTLLPTDGTSEEEVMVLLKKYMPSKFIT